MLIAYVPPWNGVLIQKAKVNRLVKKFPTFYVTRMFTTVFIELATYPYPEPHAYCPQPAILFLCVNSTKQCRIKICT